MKRTYTTTSEANRRTIAVPRRGFLPNGQRKAFQDNRESASRTKQMIRHLNAIPPDMAIQQTKNQKAPVQLKPERTHIYGSNDEFQVAYQGSKEDFSGGDDPGGSGILNVSGYDAYVNIKEPEGGEYNDSVRVSAQDRGLHKGHILSKAAGGDGTDLNLFAQDGGQNTAGKWVSFERKMTSQIGKAASGSRVGFRAELFKAIGGENLQYGANLSRINSRD